MSLNEFIDNSKKKGILNEIISNFNHRFTSKYFPHVLWRWECKKFYSSMDVKNKLIIDVGSDTGLGSPYYFIKRGAGRVIGFSLLEQKYFNRKYFHIKQSFSVGEVFKYVKGIDKDNLILKSDCEGCEWSFTPEFVSQFSDWIIAVHKPVENTELLKWLEENGNRIETGLEIEFAIFKKRG